MKTTANTHSFEIDLSNLLKPTSVIAVVQYIHTLASGDILKVTACNQYTAMAVIAYCKNSGITLLQKDYIDDGVVLFIKKS